MIGRKWFPVLAASPYLLASGVLGYLLVSNAASLCVSFHCLEAWFVQSEKLLLIGAIATGALSIGSVLFGAALIVVDLKRSYLSTLNVTLTLFGGAPLLPLLLAWFFR